MRVVFFGSSKFSEPTLHAIDSSIHQLISVVTHTDKPSGRGRNIKSPDIKILAAELGYPIFQPNDLSNEISLQMLRDCYPDVFIVVSFRKIPDKVLDIPNLFSINLHPSLLPKYRGATPIQRAIINGDKTTGISIIKLSSKIDCGNILFQKEYTINNNENAGDLSERLSLVGAKHIITTLNNIETNNYLDGDIQDEESATYAPKFENDFYKINWDSDANIIHNKIRGLSPKPGAYCLLNNKRIKIFKSKLINKLHLALIEDKNTIQSLLNLKPGYFLIMNNAIYSGTGNGIIAIKTIQIEGKRIMSIKEFITGYKGIEGHFD